MQGAQRGEWGVGRVEKLRMIRGHISLAMLFYNSNSIFAPCLERLFIDFVFEKLRYFFLPSL